jgi:hypothetical protein
MSEYQYYEFQAVDRPLTTDQMADLRKLSTRATITNTRFVNFYNWGDFRGDPLTLMERYFDAFVYVANWGTHRLMLRLPRRLLDPAVTLRYCADEGVMAYEAADSMIVEFLSQDEDGDAESDGSDWMPSLLPLRAELAGGDLRSLYLGWLFCAQSGILDDEETEPPPPPGLGSLSAALTALADFLGIDDDLIAVAAEHSAPLDQAIPPAQALTQWIQTFTDTEKDRLLLRLLQEDNPHLRAELLQRFRKEHAPPHIGRDGADGGRTVEELAAAAEQRTEARRRQEAEIQAREQARRQREHAAARARYLDSLVGRESQLWNRVVALIDTKRQADYDQAVRQLLDLRDLAARSGQAAEFSGHLRTLREQHAKKPSLMQRFDKAGLRA